MSLTAMAMPPRERGPRTSWILALAAAGACALLAWTLLGEPMPPQPLGQTPAPAAPPATASAAPVSAAPASAVTALPSPPPVLPPLPSFDIVRIGPDGDAVLAGRGPPNQPVVVADNGHAIGRVQADARGQWVALPPKLAVGGHRLTVAAAAATTAATSAPVVAVVPARGAASGPLALLAPDSGMPRLLQAPAPEPTGAAHPPPSRAGGEAASLAPLMPRTSGAALGLGIVDYDATGAIRFGGTAPAGSLVRVYVDRALAGDAEADAQGRWTLQPAANVGAGQHQLRLDQLAGGGAVAARLALPFERVLLEGGVVRDGQLVVQPGQSLWRIARGVYGHGIRYTVIYLANRSQIRNPSLIYPGQVFTLPAAPPPGDSSRPNPAAASASR